uniref:Uncharacterized protein n=1 Tax=Alexandrium catenella TaxID=2925 RepID=A0A7S1RGR0_ALECA|eukprot:CAMPEP_0171175500 /NCGR_PEP_ID=MMETSP0790-20130122/11260_1 /TAXON_ID=2925 /ORGANISM="Alexandrium catenella, Strain OF101" /LENGTH=585 /DNA_ID=CAMNT_0011640377 /DNA_START=57 /DNA_END=1814 /DNA_ORIENTATION=+
MAAGRAVLLLFPLLAVCAHGLREISRLKEPESDSDGDIRKYKVGEFMQYQELAGPNAGQWVKCSITALGDLPDTYNLYVWSADPHKRNLINIPVEVLRSQADLDAVQRVIDAVTERVRAEAEAKRKIQEEAERLAKLQEESRRFAVAQAEKKAAEEAEERRKIAEWKRKKIEDEERRVREAEEARLAAEKEAQDKAEREEAARKRKIYLKAKWEQVKAMKAQADAEAKAEEEKRIEDERVERKARGEKQTTTPKPLADAENIKVVIKYEGHPDVTLKVKRNLRLRALMAVAAEKMNVDPESVHFTIGKRVFLPEETAAGFGPHDKTVVHMDRVSTRERATQLRLVAERTGAHIFEVGDFVQANATNNQGQVISVPCIVRSKGSMADYYDIRFMFATGGQQELHNFPARLLEKVRGKDNAAAVKDFRDNPDLATKVVQALARHTPVQQLDETMLNRVSQVTVAEASKARGEPASAFEVGSYVQFTLKDGTAVPGTVTTVNEVLESEDSHDRTYDLHVLFAPAIELRALRDIRGVPGKSLKTLGARPYVEAVQRLKQDSARAQRVLELAQREASAHSPQTFEVADGV